MWNSCRGGRSLGNWQRSHVKRPGLFGGNKSGLLMEVIKAGGKTCCVNLMSTQDGSLDDRDVITGAPTPLTLPVHASSTRLVQAAGGDAAKSEGHRSATGGAR